MMTSRRICDAKKFEKMHLSRGVAGVFFLRMDFFVAIARENA